MPNFNFDEQQMRRLVRQLVRQELSPRQDILNQHYPQQPVIEHLAGTAYSTITARAGAVPGTGQVQAKKFISGTAADYADTTGNLIDVLNFGAVIASGSYVICHRHRESGKWLVEVPQGGDNSTSAPASNLAVYWSARNTAQTISAGATATVDFDSEGPKSGDMWSFNTGTNLLTVNATFEAECSISLQWAYTGTPTADEINDIAFILERDSADEVPRSAYHFPVYYITTNLAALYGTMQKTFPLTIDSGDTFRVRFINATTGIDIRIDDETTPGEGASWSIRAVGPIQ